jgi:hypothetical protein
MKKYLSRLILAIFCIALPAISFAADDKLPERRAILGKWLTEAEKTASKARDKDVDAIIGFLKDGLYLGGPYPREELAAKVLEGPKRGSRVMVVPLVEGDQHVSGAWREAWNNNFASYFIPNPKTPMIVLKDNIKMTKTWKSFVLIHEGSHALAFVAGAFDRIADPVMRRAVDEYYAYSNEFIVLDAVGGPAYRKLLAEEAGKIKSLYRKEAKVRIPDYKQARKLDSIFGKPQSEMERKIRWSTIWIRAVFKAMDDIYGPDGKAQQAKIDFLRSAYRAGNLQ